MNKYILGTLLSILIILCILLIGVKYITKKTQDRTPLTENKVIDETATKVTTEVPAVEQKIPKTTSKPKEKPGEIIGTEITGVNIFNAINWERYKLGINLLKRQTSLDVIAQMKLQDMQDYNYWAHDNPVTGKKFYKWFADKNGQYYYLYTGEILALDYTTVQDVIKGWINSPTHYAVITNQNRHYTDVGIAVSGNLVVVEFAVDPKIVSGESLY